MGLPLGSKGDSVSSSPTAREMSRVVIGSIRCGRSFGTPTIT